MRDLPLWFRVTVIVAIAAGIFFRFYELDRKTFWEDELFGTLYMTGHTELDLVRRSASLTSAGDVQSYLRLPAAGSGARDTIADTTRALSIEDVQHPPLYYVLGQLWIRAFGSSAATIRALSAAIAVFAIPAVFWLALELFGSRAIAWTAAALVALSPFDVLYAQEAREYGLWTVMILITGIAFLRACRLGTRAAWTAYGAALTVALYVYPLTLLVALGFGAFLLSVRALRTRGTLAAYAGSSFVAVLLFSPWLVLLVTDLVKTRGVPPGMVNIMALHMSVGNIAATFLRNLRQVFVDFGRFSIGHVSSTAVNAALTAAVAALVVYAIYALRSDGTPRATRFILIALGLPAVPLVLHDAIFGGQLVVQSRYFVPAYLAVQLAIAAFLATATSAAVRPRRIWAVSLLFVTLGAGFASCAISSQAETWWNKDYEVSRDVADVVNGSQRAIVVGDLDTSRILGLSYYLSPSVALRVRLRCDVCSVPKPPQRDLLAGTDRFDEVFLLGDAVGSDIRDGKRYRRIGTKIYATAATPLGMFLPI